MLDPEEKLSFTIERSEEKTVVKLKGIIDEDAKFDELASITGAIDFNFKEIESINSIGIRNWINFINAVEGETFLSEVPPVIVRQLNMVPSFLGNSKVLSVFVPYVCDECNAEKSTLIEHSKFFDSSMNFDDVIKCESCGEEEMAFDGTPEQYFAFAK